MESVFTKEERELLFGCDALTAERVQSKREERKRRRLRNLRRSASIIALFAVIGVIMYGAGAGELLDSVNEQGNAGASELALPASTPIYACFATVGTSSLELALPGKVGSVTAVGFHEAERKEAVAIKPSVECFNKESTTTVRETILASEDPVLFIMTTRWRGSAPTSAMDVAMKPDSEVYAPVTGVVREVKMYNLYGKVNDYHIEVEPIGYPDIRVAMIHIKDPEIRIGDRVVRQKTKIGIMRTLPASISAQINKYLPAPSDHVHIQVNPATLDEKVGS